MPKVIHFEIHAQEPEKAVEFYTKVFDWKIAKWDGPMEYWLVTAGEKEEAGADGAIMRRHGEPPQDKSAVNAYVCTISVKNLDESLKKVLVNGGTETMPKMPVPGIGWLAYCKDNQGNIFGMMQDDPSAK